MIEASTGTVQRSLLLNFGRINEDEEGDACDQEHEGKPLTRRHHWTEVTLVFADELGLVSRWRGDHAEQTGGHRQMTNDAATAEHLGALQEIRCTGGSTNWITDLSVAEIDWTDFPGIGPLHEEDGEG